MMHVPKLRSEQRTEVPEHAAAAAVGTHDAATSSQRFHVPSETANAHRVGGWAFTKSVAKTREDGPSSSIETHPTIGVTLSQFESYRL